MSPNARTSEAALATISAFENRGWSIRLAVGAVIGICVGAIVGGLVFQLLSSDTTVTAYIRINQPADLVAIAGGAAQTTPNTQDNNERYVAGEVAFLSGQGLAKAVGEKLGESEPASFEVTQDGRSSVVGISSTSTSSGDAVRTVQTTIDLYGQQRAQRTDQELRIILPALAQWEQNASTVEGRQGIQQLRDRIQLQAAQASAVDVIQPPTPADASSHRWLIGSVLGALLGGAFAVLLLIGRRRRSGRVAPGPEIADAVDGILVPVVELSKPSGDSWSAAQAALARSLFAQLPTQRTARTIVVIGASSTSGTAVVASLLEFAAAEIGPVEAISLVDGEFPSSPRPERATVVVDAGAIGESKWTPAAIRLATVIVVVGRLGTDTIDDTLVVRSATSVSDAPLLAVFTSGSANPRHRADAKADVQ